MSFKNTRCILVISFFLVIKNTVAQNPSALYQNWVNSQINNTESTLPTFSYAGYHNGEIGLPTVFSQQIYDVTQSPYNAVANDNKSDKEAIKAAIADAEANPNGGIVFFPSGRFIVNDANPTEQGVIADDPTEVIRISKSNIVIKGSGSGIGGTELYQKSNTTHPDMATKDWTCPYLFLFWNDEDSANTFITNVTGNAARETFTIQVTNTANVSEGQWVELYVKNSDANFVEEELLPFSTADLFESENLKIVTDGVEIREIHKVVSKTSNTITFKEPIHRAINASYNWKINSFKALEEVGFQDLKYTGGFIWDHLHHIAPQELYPSEGSTGPHAYLSSSGWSGIRFNHVVNGWIKNVEFSAMSQVAQFKFSAYNTAINNTYTGNPGHNFISTNSSTGCLIGKNIDYTTGVWHGCGVNGVDIGNVLWRNESPQNGNSGIEVHASQPRVTLIDVCKGGMFFNQGGSLQALPNHLKNMVLWNFEGVSYQNTNVKTFRPNSETKYAKFITPIISGLKGFTMSSEVNQFQVNESEGTHVDEESLYESQLKYRLGTLPRWGNPDSESKIIYLEDFLNDTGRGFEEKLINDGGYATPTSILDRNNNVPDLVDSNNLFDPAVDKGEIRVPNGNNVDQRVIRIRGTFSNTNYASDVYAVFTTLDLTSSNSLITSNDTYKYASFWSQRRYGQGDIATITMKVSTDYAGDPSTANWTIVPLHSGKIGNSTLDDQKYVKGIVDLTSFANGINGSTVTLALHYKGSASTYSGSNRNGTFLISDLQFIAQPTEMINIWNGSNSSDLNEPANWDTKAAPTSTINNLVVPANNSNYPTATTALTINSLTIESGASFIAESTVSGNVTYKRNLSYKEGNAEGWHLVGAPVSGQPYNNDYATVNSIASSNNKRGIAVYNNGIATNNWTYLESNDSNSGVFGKAKGYSIKTSITTDISFTGTLNTDDVNKDVIVGLGTPLNLISNPFTSYINSDVFLSSNTDKLESQTLYVWNPSTKNYDAKVTLDAFKIAPSQAFFINCRTDGDVIFDEVIQSHEATNTFLKSSPKQELQLNITDGKSKRFAKIYYNQKATTGFDNGYDGATFKGGVNKFDVFTHLLENNKGENYQIQSLPNSDLESMVIPVGLKSEAGKEIKFSAEALNLPSGIKVFLEDRENNIFTRLDEAKSNYKVTLIETINGTGRFYLHTKSNALSTDIFELNDASVYKTTNSTLRIAGLKQGKSTFILFNILGKQVMSSSFKSNGVKELSLPKLAKGIYVVQLTTATGKLNKKIILE